MTRRACIMITAAAFLAACASTPGAAPQSEPARPSTVQVERAADVWTAGGLCIDRRFDETRTLHKFAAPGWPPGTVCLVEEDDKVSEIIWAFELTNGFL